VDFDGARALEASQRLGADSEIDDGFLSENCPRVVTAVRRIADWASSLR
jgi:hypothetical protein